MFCAPNAIHIAFSSDGSQAVDANYELPEGRSYLITGVFFDAGTTGGFTTATIKDSYGVDILAGQGASAQSADHLYTWSDLGGGVVVNGTLNVVMAGAGVSKAGAWRVMCVGVR